MPGMMNMFQLSTCSVLNWQPPKGNKVSLPKQQPQGSKPTSRRHVRAQPGLCALLLNFSHVLQAP